MPLGVLQQHVDAGHLVCRDRPAVLAAHAADTPVGVAQADIESPAQRSRRSERIRKKHFGDTLITRMDEADERDFAAQKGL